jgi:hypothetical protein
MALFLKVVRKDPFIFGVDYLEGYLAIGAEDQISWLLVALERDFGVTDRTLQFSGHGLPPWV